jgi:His-Xaa-Ser repeat protein HxsA
VASDVSSKGLSTVNGRKFLIPSLLIAGFSSAGGAQEASETVVTVESKEQKGRTAALSLFRQERPIQLASHSSHRSHSSHSSHRSSSGGGYYPAPLYSPPPPPPPPRRAAPLFSVPNIVVSPEDGFIAVVKRVQTGLKAYGYYSGEVDGEVGAETRAALNRLQTDFSLKVTGTITPEVLKALNIKF